MAESSRRMTMPPHETLEALNSHLGRFLSHTDELLQECLTFGESVRTSLDAQLGKLNTTVAGAIETAGQRAAERIDRQIDRALGERVAALRQELLDLTRLAGQAAEQVRGVSEDMRPSREAGHGRATAVPEPASTDTRAWRGLPAILLVAANVMLAALLILAVVNLGRNGQPGATGTAGAGAAGAAGTGNADGTGGAQAGDPAGTAAGSAGAGQAGASAGAGDRDGGPNTQAGNASGTAAGAADPAATALCEALATGRDPDKAKELVAASARSLCGERAEAVTANALQALSAAASEPQGASPTKPAGKSKASEPGAGTRKSGRQTKTP